MQLFTNLLRAYCILHHIKMSGVLSYKLTNYLSFTPLSIKYLVKMSCPSSQGNILRTRLQQLHIYFVQLLAASSPKIS